MSKQKILTKGDADQNSVSKYITLNAQGRESVEGTFRIGVNSFNTYVAPRNVDAKMLAFYQSEGRAGIIALAMQDAETESVFYTVDGGDKGGLLGGSAQLARFEIEGLEREILQHSSGAFIDAKMIRGLKVLRDADVIELAHKGDLRKFKVTDNESGKESLYAGALIGSMSDKRQVLIVNNGDGLSMVPLITGDCGELATSRAVEMGALSDADKLTLRVQLFEGRDVSKGKATLRNHAKRTRKALRDLAKAAVATS